MSAAPIAPGVLANGRAGAKPTRERVPGASVATALNPDTTSPGASEAPWVAPIMRPVEIEGPGPGFGLGVGAPAGRLNPNLSYSGLANVVDPTEIANIARSDQARRLAAHRELWKVEGLDRWRSAIEGYVPRVRFGNQVALGAARGAFAAFLRSMAKRIRPAFVDDFVTWIQSLPSHNPLRRPHLDTRLEIVLDASGNVARMGVILTSGVTAFDVGALDAVQRAGPFGPAPAEILSPDGRVYIQWDLHGDVTSVFSDQDARPSILREAPQGTK
jgi:TonB family protein